jgi:phosphodiesterase/alkaline phosphatase D-like protein
MRKQLKVLFTTAIVVFALCGLSAFAQNVQITNGPTVQNVGQNSATVIWSTNVPAGTVVKYGTDPNNLSQTAQQSWGGTNHSEQLSNLQPGTKYYFQVQSNNGLGTGSGIMSGVESFTTPGQQNASAMPNGQNGMSGAPEGNIQVIAGPIVQEVQEPNAVEVWWQTNGQSSTILKYGTSPNNLSQQAEQPWGEQSHTVRLTNLQPGATYYYQVATTAGRVLDQGTFQVPNAQQAQMQFRITHGPVIEKLGPSSLVVAWTTNVPSSSTVKYGTQPNHLNETAQAAWGQQTHRVTINNLQPNTKYFFQVQTAQAQGTGEALASAVFQAVTEAPGQQAMSFNTK